MIERLRYPFSFNRISKILVEAEAKVKEIDDTFQRPPNLRVRFWNKKFGCKINEIAKIHVAKDFTWTLYFNPKYNNGSDKFILFAVTHELCHYWIGEDIGLLTLKNICQEIETHRTKLHEFLETIPCEMRKDIKYKKYEGISTILEEMLIDYALTRMLDTDDVDIENELKDLREIMNQKCINSLLLKYVEDEIPNLPKVIEKLVKFPIK